MTGPESSSCQTKHDIFEIHQVTAVPASRPDIWDSAALCEPWNEASIEADAEWRRLRFSQLAAAYGMSAGGAVAAALAAAEDAAAAVQRALAAGVSASEAVAACCESSSWLVLTMLCVASACPTRPRRKRVPDGGAASVALVLHRAAVEGASARAVNEAIKRAATDPPALAQLAALMRRALVGGYVSCVRRPSAATRARLATVADASLVEAVMGAARDAPIGAAAVVEHAAAMDDRSAVGLAAMCGGDARWRARVERARLVMETLRAGLDASWTEGMSLNAAVSVSSVADAVRRAHRRTAAPPGTSERSPPAAWVRLEAAAGAGTPDSGLLTRLAQGEPLNLALAAVTPRAAEACLRGDCSSVTGTERGALVRAVRTLQCARRLRVMRLCRRQVAGAPSRDVVVCMGCFAVKNFINRRGEDTSAASACGFRDMMPANRLFNVQEPRCTARPECASAPLFTVRLAAPSGALLADDQIIVVSSCCGLVCTAAAVTPRADGTWRCVACSR